MASMQRKSPPAQIAAADRAAAARYARPVVYLHWVSAILIVSLVALGYRMVAVPRHVPLRGMLLNVHKSLGVAAFVLVCLRLAVRWRHRPPPLPGHYRPWQRRMAALNHGLLYVAMVLQPVTGYASSALTAFGVRFFGLPLPTVGPGHERLHELLTTAHHGVAAALIALILIHFLGVAKNLVTSGRQSLRRML